MKDSRVLVFVASLWSLNIMFITTTPSTETSSRNALFLSKLTFRHVSAQTEAFQRFTVSASHLVAVVWGCGVDKLDPFGFLHESFLPELWQRSLMETKKRLKN